MQLITRIHVLTLALGSAIVLPQAVYAGHEELVQQHRFVRAELSGVLYLPDAADVSLATGAPRSPAAVTTLVTASHTCSERPDHACAATGTHP